MSDVNTYDMARELAESLDIDNVEWSAWELEFIESFADKVLDGEAVTFTARQSAKIAELWEKL